MLASRCIRASDTGYVNRVQEEQHARLRNRANSVGGGGDAAEKRSRVPSRTERRGRNCARTGSCAWNACAATAVYDQGCNTPSAGRRYTSVSLFPFAPFCRATVDARLHRRCWDLEVFLECDTLQSESFLEYVVLFDVEVLEMELRGNCVWMKEL